MWVGFRTCGIPVLYILWRNIVPTVHDHGDPAERYLLSAAVVNLKSFIRIENARQELGLYCSMYVRDKCVWYIWGGGH